jgi:hypothetical protein
VLVRTVQVGGQGNSDGGRVVAGGYNGGGPAKYRGDVRRASSAAALAQPLASGVYVVRTGTAALRLTVE